MKDTKPDFLDLLMRPRDRNEPADTPVEIGLILPDVLRDIEQRMEKDEQGLD